MPKIFNIPSSWNSINDPTISTISQSIFHTHVWKKKLTLSRSWRFAFWNQLRPFSSHRTWNGEHKYLRHHLFLSFQREERIFGRKRPFFLFENTKRYVYFFFFFYKKKENSHDAYIHFAWIKSCLIENSIEISSLIKKKKKKK